MRPSGGEAVHRRAIFGIASCLLPLVGYFGGPIIYLALAQGYVWSLAPLFAAYGGLFLGSLVGVLLGIMALVRKERLFGLFGFGIAGILINAAVLVTMLWRMYGR